MQNFSPFLQGVARSSKHYAGPIVALVTARRDVYAGYGHDVYCGQVCFVAESRLSEDLHAFRCRGETTVCIAQPLGGGRVLLSWGSPGTEIVVPRDELEHLGVVVGCGARDDDPVLWMFSN